MSTPKKKKKGAELIDNLLGGERRRHQVAMITEEGEWNQHESNSSMARVFVVMLLVHVVLIGSIIVYDFIGTEESQPAPAPTVSARPTADQHELATPTLDTTKAPDTASAPSAIPVGGQYEVKSGDSLPLIAAREGVDINELIALNNLEQGDLELKPLTLLKLPLRKAEPAKVAVVKEFPTPGQAELASIAPEPVLPIEQPPAAPSNATETQPAMASAPPVAPAAEPIPAPQLSPVVQSSPPPALPAPKPVPTPSELASSSKSPAKTTPAPKTEVKAKTEPASSGSRTHVMAKGDTLYGLARKYGVSVSAIQKANKITKPEAIRDGTKLVIPAK